MWTVAVTPALEFVEVTVNEPESDTDSDLANDAVKKTLHIRSPFSDEHHCWEVTCRSDKVVLHDSKIFIQDDRCVHVFRRDGSRLRTLQLGQRSRLQTVTDSAIFASRDHRIFVFDHAGVFQSCFGVRKYLEYVCFVTATGSELLVTVLRDDDRELRVHDLDGTFLRQMPLIGAPMLTLALGQGLYLAALGYAVKILKPDGSKITEVAVCCKDSVVFNLFAVLRKTGFLAQSLSPSLCATLDESLPPHELTEWCCCRPQALPCPWHRE